jgi:ABC-2 type transport system ATP-binding protein
VGTTAVAVEGVSKRFRLYHEKYTSLKERVIHAGRIPYEDLWALRDVSFEVQEGETVGILGRNGSGKSTLLKCVCGVLQPTSGQITLRGKLAGLLELGAGFQQELSGRENVYLNGSMLGLSRREVDRKFDEIVEFAELGQFIDNQVKFYSSGMYVRLGFAVAVTVDPDVLVIDEVLAVGDERFQRKCMERVKRLQREGRTILFVSHSPDQVRAICDRAVVLSQGGLIGVGSPGEAVRLFREGLLEAGDTLPGGVDEHSGAHPAPEAEPSAAEAAAAWAAGVTPPLRLATADSRPIRLGEITAAGPAAGERHYLLPGEPLVLRVPFEASRRVERAVFQAEIVNGDATTMVRTDTENLGLAGAVEAGSGTLELVFESVPLGDGAYDVNVGVLTERGQSDWREPAARFEVMNPTKTTGMIVVPVRATLGSAAERRSGRAGCRRARGHRHDAARCGRPDRVGGRQRGDADGCGPGRRRVPGPGDGRDRSGGPPPAP